MDPCALPEVILSFGRIPITDYATPGTKEGAEIVKDLIQRFDALVLDRHGTLTVGQTMRDAYFKLDKLEHGAHVLLMAHGLGRTQRLAPQEVAKLAALREAMGLGRADDVPRECQSENPADRRSS
jgi:L-fuculose-phosphate aldolase